MYDDTIHIKYIHYDNIYYRKIILIPKYPRPIILLHTVHEFITALFIQTVSNLYIRCHVMLTKCISIQIIGVLNILWRIKQTWVFSRLFFSHIIKCYKHWFKCNLINSICYLYLYFFIIVRTVSLVIVILEGNRYQYNLVYILW